MRYYMEAQPCHSKKLVFLKNIVLDVTVINNLCSGSYMTLHLMTQSDESRLLQRKMFEFNFIFHLIFYHYYTNGL